MLHLVKVCTDMATPQVFLLHFKSMMLTLPRLPPWCQCLAANVAQALARPQLKTGGTWHLWTPLENVPSTNHFAITVAHPVHPHLASSVNDDTLPPRVGHFGAAA